MRIRTNHRPENVNGAVLVTGASSGIGLAIARHLSQNGFVVFATVRKERDVEALRSLGAATLIPLFPLDLGKPEHIPAIRDQVAVALEERGLSGLRALVNNAGSGVPAPVELLDLSILKRELEVRVVGGVAMAQAFLPLLRAGDGRLLWIATPATIPTPYVASIHACDFAVNCLARTLEIELAAWNIPNVMVRCGGIKTPAGLRTTAQVSELLSRLPPLQAALYEAQLREWAAEMAQFDDRRTEPEVVARLVARILQTRSPKRRYSVGYMARAAAMLEILPQAMTDRILAWRFRPRGRIPRAQPL